MKFSSISELSVVAVLGNHLGQALGVVPAHPAYLCLCGRAAVQLIPCDPEVEGQLAERAVHAAVQPRLEHFPYVLDHIHIARVRGVAFLQDEATLLDRVMDLLGVVPGSIIQHQAEFADVHVAPTRLGHHPGLDRGQLLLQDFPHVRRGKSRSLGAVHILYQGQAREDTELANEANRLDPRPFSILILGRRPSCGCVLAPAQVVALALKLYQDHLFSGKGRRSCETTRQSEGDIYGN